jgi:hypothetical protein
MTYWQRLEKLNSGIMLVPTLFHWKELWTLNSRRCGGHFNKIFFPLYIIFIPYCLGYTLLVMLEAVLPVKE